MITEDKITEIFCMADDFCKIQIHQGKRSEAKACQEETGVSPGSETVRLGSDDNHDTVSLQRLQVP